MTDILNMTLSEIYGQPNVYFERDESRDTPMAHLGITYTRYRGKQLRENGTQFFTIKDDDYWDAVGGADGSYADPVIAHLECEVCNPHPDDYDTPDSQMGEDLNFMATKAHP